MILRVMWACERIGRRVAEGQDADPAVLREIVEFIRIFAELCHHAKEEDVLFPALERAGVPPDDQTLALLREDHVRGRELLAGLEEAEALYASGAAGGREAVVAALQDMVKFYSGHIWREDATAFLMYERLLDKDQSAFVVAEFDAVDARVGREAVLRCREFASRVASPVISDAM